MAITVDREQYQHSLGFMVANLNMNLRRLNRMINAAEGERAEKLEEVRTLAIRMRDALEALA